MSEKNTAEWPGKKTNGERGKRSELAGEMIEGRKEELFENEGSGCPVEVKVVPLDNGPNKTRRHNSTETSGVVSRSGHVLFSQKRRSGAIEVSSSSSLCSFIEH